VLASSSAADLN